MMCIIGFVFFSAVALYCMYRAHSVETMLHYWRDEAKRYKMQWLAEKRRRD